MEIPTFKNKKELFKFLVENKGTLIAQKKAEIKHSDGINYYSVLQNTNKAASESNNVEVKVVINTTNLMDSHDDVHLPGLWNKSLNDNKNIMHLQEHKMKFDSIISDGDDLRATVKEYTWEELGYSLEGKTQALVFDSVIKENRNKYMAAQYKQGFVKNHSVGMQYVKLIMAINDEDYGAEFEAWEKYYPMIANKERADDLGYFWAVKEAKVIEGSAVPVGSNHITPTLEVKEPPEGTPTEPSKGTQTKSNILLNYF